MRNVRLIVAMGATATCANASLVGLRFAVSLDHGATWSTSVNATPGSNVRVGIFADHDASVYGFSGAVVRVNGTGLAAGDFAGGIHQSDMRVAPFDFGTNHQALFRTGSSFRLDEASDAANSATVGISIFQRPPSIAGAAYESGSGVLVYSFSMDIGADASARIINLFADQVKNGVMKYHASPADTHSIDTPDYTLAGASIVVVPAPASLAMLGLGGVFVARRRRHEVHHGPCATAKPRP